MNDRPRRTLRELVARHGRALAADPRRCEALLRDYCGEYRREVSVLVMAVEERVAQELLAPGATPRELLLARLSQQLCDQLALSEEAARWSIDSWALALGVMTDDDLKAAERPNPAPAETDTKPRAGSRPAPAIIPPPVPAPAPAPVPAHAPAAVVVSAAGDGDFQSVGEALRHAPPGARVLVRPGLYAESIVIDREVELVGDGPREEVVIMGVDASCLRMRADRARVAGLTLRGAGRGGAAFFAVDITRGRLALEDCDVTSETLSCVAVHGPAAEPSLRGCRIHDGADSGVYFFEGAAGLVEDCEVYGHANVGVAVTGGARPTLRRSKIHDGADAGVVVWQEGTALVESCDIYRQRRAGVGVSEGGRITLSACRIFEGENSGVFVHQGGEARLDACELFGHRAAGAAVTTRGKLFLDGCDLRDGLDSGVFVGEGGQALLQECDVRGHAGAGVAVGAGALAVLRRCRVNGNGHAALGVAAGGKANVEESDLTGNRSGAWELEEGAVVEAARNADD